MRKTISLLMMAALLLPGLTGCSARAEQRTGEAQVEQQTSHREAQGRRRGEKGQDAQGFRKAQLDGPGSRAGQQQILKMSQHRVQGGNDGRVGQMAGIGLHTKHSKTEKWAQSAPIPIKK